MSDARTNVRVKVCGITSVEDALMAASLGVDAIGLNFHPGSPRYVEPARAREIARALPPFLVTVGVFVDLPEADVDRIAREVGLDRLQLHGDEDPDYCRRRSLPVIKALASKPGRDARDADRYAPFPILLDGHRTGLAGGTGRLADWGMARVLVERGVPVILAGGLNPENVSEAVEAVGPMAVDLNSGVESAPGVKDRALLARALDALGRLRVPASMERRITE